MARPKVFAIDVGHGQIDPSLRGDPRVVIREGLNARALTAADIDGETPDFLVCDVSFISLKLALPPALALAAPGAMGVFLVKPQFEAGREAIGKGGILKNAEDGPRIAQELADWIDAMPGWRASGMAPVADRRWRRQSRVPARRHQGSPMTTLAIDTLGAQGDGVAHSSFRRRSTCRSHCPASA